MKGCFQSTRNRARWFLVLTLRCRGARVHPIDTLLAWRRRGLHVRRRDPPYDHGVAVDLPDHAAHELGRIGAVLQGEVATRLIGQDERPSVGVKAIRGDTGRLRLERQQEHQSRRRHHAARREKPSTPSLHTTILPIPRLSIAGPIDPSPYKCNTGANPHVLPRMIGRHFRLRDTRHVAVKGASTGCEEGHTDFPLPRGSSIFRASQFPYSAPHLRRVAYDQREVAWLVATRPSTSSILRWKNPRSTNAWSGFTQDRR